MCILMLIFRLVRFKRYIQKHIKGGNLIIMSLLSTLAKKEYREIELCYEEKQWMRCYRMCGKNWNHLGKITTSSSQLHNKCSKDFNLQIAV